MKFTTLLATLLALASSVLAEQDQPIQASKLPSLTSMMGAAGTAAAMAAGLPDPKVHLSTTAECKANYDKEKAAGCVSKYTLGKELGHGFFGTVYKATHKETGKVVALKCKRRGNDDMLVKEYCYQHNARHKYVLEVFELTCHNGGPCIAMQLADGGSLTNVAEKREGHLIAEEEAKHFFKQWAEGISHLHMLGMANRDIKPDNVLLVGNQVKVCDFGITCYSKSKYHKYNCEHNVLMGTPGYKPDEPGTLLDLQADVRTRDVYALGMSWRELVTGEKPSFIALFDSRTTKRRCGISRELVDLINGMIRFDPKKRLTIDQVLAHPWMTGGKLEGKYDDSEWERRCQLLYDGKKNKDATATKDSKPKSEVIAPAA